MLSKINKFGQFILALAIISCAITAYSYLATWWMNVTLKTIGKLYSILIKK